MKALLHSEDVSEILASEDHWFVCRVKDAWTGKSKAGWRDYKINVQYSGVVFEIQVVLEGMLKARSQLDGHANYNKFRFLSECINYPQDVTYNGIVYPADASLPARLEVASYQYVRT